MPKINISNYLAFVVCFSALENARHYCTIQQHAAAAELDQENWDWQIEESFETEAEAIEYIAEKTAEAEKTSSGTISEASTVKEITEALLMAGKTKDELKGLKKAELYEIFKNLPSVN